MESFAKAWTSFFTMLDNLFSATNKLAVSLNNVATVAEQTSGEMADASIAQRAKRMAALTAE